MVKKLTKRVHLLALASMLIGAMFGAFNNFVVLAQSCDIFENPFCEEQDQYLDPGGYPTGGGGGSGGTAHCVNIPSGCGSFGCNGYPGHYTCTLYRLDNSTATCTNGGPCSN